MSFRLTRWLSPALLVVVGLGVLACESLVAPDPPSGTTGGDPAMARTQLEALAVKPRGPMTGYSREKFPHWVTVSGQCNAREEVLRRDGKDVQVDAECRPVSGSWFSPYDGETHTDASDVDIDHWVPLAEGWRSGAADWTEAKRTEFANDLTRHQLIAVTDRVNQAKGDQAPDQWKPPVISYWCTYAINWIEVKNFYGLSVTIEERAALLDMLGHC
jgi:hypothetical protein